MSETKTPYVRAYWSPRVGDDDIDCQAAKNSEDLEIAQQNGGALQAGAEELEISYIMDKYKKTGVLPDLIAADPTYGDFSEPLDFIKAHEIVSKATEQFEALDSHIRTRFQNDPAEFLRFATDEANVEEMRKMGLAKPLPEAAPAPAGGQPAKAGTEPAAAKPTP